MRYVATFYPLQSRLEPDQCGRGCIHAGCQGVSNRHGRFFVVVIIYIVCALGNLPSFYLFRAVPIAVLDSTGASTTFIDFNVTDEQLNIANLILTPAQPSTEISGLHPFLKPFPDADTFVVAATTPFSVLLHDVDDNNLLYIDLGPFSHHTGPGVVFHWVKSALSIFIPGILLTFFNIRLIQAIRQSERMRNTRGGTVVSGSTPPPSGGLSMAGCRAPNSRWVASRNRLNVTLVAVIVMFVCLVYPCEFLDFVVHLTPFSSPSVDREAMMLTRMFLNALQLSNFALNFFLYCTVNAQFRRAFTDWFCRRSRFLRNQENYRRAFRATPAAMAPVRRDDIRTMRNDDMKVTQLRGAGLGGGACASCQSAIDAEKVHVGSHVTASGGRSVPQQSGSRGSHGNGRRSWSASYCN